MNNSDLLVRISYKQTHIKRREKDSCEREKKGRKKEEERDIDRHREKKERCV